MNLKSIACAVPLALLVSAGVAQAQSKSPAKPAPAGSPAKGAKATPPAAAPKAADKVDSGEKPKSVYVVPMGLDGHGQFGLDIHPSIYQIVAEDIAAKKPNVVVYVLDSADVDKVDYMGDDPSQRGMFDDDSMRKGMQTLKETVRQAGADQVMVIKDAVGYSCLLGLYWPDMYMTSTARLAGLNRIQERTQVEDPQVRAKFLAAFVGICNGFLVSGGYDDVIGVAMMRPEKMLSATFQGRNIVWTDNDKGTWMVDNSTERVAQFSAQSAEEMGLSDGTVADENPAMLEDLMFQRGVREFERMPEDGEVIIRKYIEGWRKSLEDCIKSFESYQEAMDNAQGKDERKFLGQARGHLEKILAAFKKYPAVELKARSTVGAGKLELEVELEKLKERIRGLSKSAPAGGSGGSGKGGPTGPGLGSGG